ncbi:YggT family protein [Coriobacteriales bacterium OH1046]|nr:YggT family protein [Coriobacteriales bacterium OH1046]
MIGYTLIRLLDLYEVLIVVWCIMSWIPHANETVERIRRALGTLVEPYLAVFRRYIPPFSGIDFSPIVAIIALRLVQRAISLILYI